MENLEKIIADSSKLSEDEINKLVLKSFEPISLALYNINKEAKRLRDSIDEMQQESAIEKHKISVACDVFKIKQDKIFDGEITKTMGYEFDPKNPDATKQDLVNEIVNKMKNSQLYLVFTFNNLAHLNFFETNNEWFKEMQKYVYMYYPYNGWKNHLNELPEFNETAVRKCIENLYSYLKNFVPSPQIKEFEKKKAYFYDLKDTFLYQLAGIGLKADEIHHFGNAYKTWGTKHYLTYGGFGYHVDEDFPLIDDCTTVVTLENNIVSNMNNIYKMDVDTALDIVKQSIKILNNFKQATLTYEDVIGSVNKIIENHKELLTKCNEINEER